MLRQVPQIIDSLNTSRLWDLTLFQLESDTHTFGIPGETWCFQCDTNFQVEEQPTMIGNVYSKRIIHMQNVTSISKIMYIYFQLSVSLR